MLKANHLIGLGVGGAEKTVEYLGTDTAGGSGATFTFAGAPFGDASGARMILVGICGRHEDGGEHIDSATIGGVSATILVDVSDLGASVGSSASLFIANVPTGTSGTIVATFDTTVTNDEAVIGIWRLEGFNSYTPFDTGSNTSDDLDMTINIPAGGAAFACGLGTTGSTLSISGLSEDFSDGTFTADSAAIGGHSSDMLAETNRAISITGGGIDAAGVCVSFD